MKTIETTIENTFIRFIPTDDDQFPYRVIVDRTAKGWLGWQYEPGKKAAHYFYSKVILGIDDKSLLELATKKEKKPLAWTQKAFKKWLNEHLFEEVGVTGHWNTGNLPLEKYIAECKQAGHWHEGQFEYKSTYKGSLHVNRMKWMDRFNEYCQQHNADTLGARTCQGFEVLSLFNSKEWDNAKYDSGVWLA